MGTCAAVGRLSWPALAAVAVAGCHTTSRAPAVIGYGLPYRPGNVLPVVEHDLARSAGPRGIAIRFAVDSELAEDAPDVEVKRAERFVATPGIVGVVGHSSSRGSLAAAAVYNEAGIVQITPYSTSRLLWKAGPWTLNLAPTDSVEGAFIGGFVAGRLRARRVTVFYVNDEYGLGLREGVVAELRRRHVAVADQVSVDIDSDFSTVVAASLERAVPDAVVVAGRQRETGKIAAQLRARGVPRAVVGGDGAMVMPVLEQLAGAAADSVYAVTFWMPDAPDSASRAFVAEYRQIVGGAPQASEAMTYDALMLMATAIRAVGPRPAAVRRYLDELGRGRSAYLGVTGPVSFAPDSGPRLQMIRLRGGHAVHVAWP